MAKTAPLRAAVLGGLAALAASAAHAQAPEPARLTLLCVGTDATMVAVTPYVGGRRGYLGTTYAETRMAAQLGVAVDAGKVRVRPPASSVPIFAKGSPDGWYDLADVAVDRLTIKGRLKWNRLDRSKLVVDRRTGLATFGAFEGVCQPVPNGPAETKF